MNAFPIAIGTRGSFRRQIILIFVVGFFMLIAGFSVYMSKVERDYVYQDARNDTTMLAEVLAAGSRPRVIANDVVGLQEVVAGFKRYSPLRYAMVLSPGGRVLAHTDATKVGQSMTDEHSLALLKSAPQPQVLSGGAPVIDIAVPILVNKQIVAWARVGEGMDDATEMLRGMMWNRASIVLLGSALAALAAALVARRLGARIDTLVRAAERVQSGDFETRVMVGGSEDEISELAESFNRMLDVIARKQQELGIASHYTRSLIEASLDPLVTINAQGKITDVNEATISVTGVPRDQLVGADFSTYFTEPDKAREGYKRVFAEGFVTDYPLTIRHRDGRLTEVLYNASVYRDIDGGILGVFAAARDVTERKRAEDALFQAQQVFRTLVENSPDIITRYDRECRRTYVNPAYLKIAQMTKGELIGETPRGHSPLPPASAAQLQNLLHRVIDHGTGESVDVVWPMSDNMDHWYNIYAYPEFDRAGHVVSVMTVSRDITERKQDENALREKEERLALATLHNGIGIWDWNLQTQEMVWDDSMYALYHIRREDFSGTEEAWRAALHPDDLERGDREVADAIEDRKPFDTEFRVVWPNGEIRYIKAVAKVFRDDEGRPLRMLGTNMDVTDRKRAEQELQALNNNFVTLLENTSDFMYFKDKDGRFIFCSQTLADITGHASWRDMVGKHDLEVFPPDTARIYYEEEQPIFREGKPLLNKIDPYYDNEGHRRWVNTNKWPVFGDDKKTVIGLFGMSRDITVMKRREDIGMARLRLMEAAAKLTLTELLVATLDEACALSESSVGFYHFLDADQKTLSLQAWSTRTLKEFCKAEGDGRHYNVDEAGVWVECIRQRRPVIHNDYGALPNKRGMPPGHAHVEREMVIPIFRGELIVAILGVGNKATPYNEDDLDSVTQLADLAWDIALAKRAEGEVRQMNVELEHRVEERTAELETAVKEVEGFSYSVSHDLRTPLRAIDGFSNMLLEDYAGKLDAEGVRLLNVVRANTKRMSQLIDDILQFSRTGRLPMKEEEVDLEELARTVLDELPPMDARSSLQIEIGHLPPALGDRSMLRQVLVNLLSNAIKFSRGQAVPRVEVGGRIEGNEAIYFVRDNGVGFDMQYVDKLFGVFQRLHSMSEFEGTGIGLAIVKRIVTRHGGRVWAEGKVNEGATIYFALPAKENIHG